MINTPNTYTRKGSFSTLSVKEQEEISSPGQLNLSKNTITRIELPEKDKVALNESDKQNGKTFNDILYKKDSGDFTSHEILDEEESELIQKQKYSNNYISYEVAALIETLIKNLRAWKAKGTPNSYSEISYIKTQLEEYSEYLEQKDETRVLLGVLEVLFENDNWQKVEDKKLNLLINELEKFRDGEVNFRSLETFSKQIWSGNVISE